MPSPGLSLVGFMDQAQALTHLRQACVPAANATDADLLAQWTAAQAKIDLPAPTLGVPDIQDIPASHIAYAQALFRLQWVANEFTGTTTTASNVKMVEIDPLLAYQFTVDLARSGHHCGHLGAVPTIDELFNTCLPNTQPIENFSFQKLANSAIIKSRSLNLRVKVEGIIQNQLAGIIFGPSLPLVQVVRVNGRCFLYNGFHRAVGLRRAGATHIPCVLRDVVDVKAAGIRDDGATFPEAILMSSNPPTLRHFTQGLAADVQIRATARILHVSWSDYVWADE
jgi:hypothetical protein